MSHPQLDNLDRIGKPKTEPAAELWNSHIIGEAAKQAPDDIQATQPMVEWRKIAGLRDVSARLLGSRPEFRLGRVDRSGGSGVKSVGALLRGSQSRTQILGIDRGESLSVMMWRTARRFSGNTSSK